MDKLLFLALLVTVVIIALQSVNSDSFMKRNYGKLEKEFTADKRDEPDSITSTEEEEATKRSVKRKGSQGYKG